MDDYLKEALEITRAQAGVRVMSEEEIAAFIQKVAQGIKSVAEGETPVELDSGEMAVEAAFGQQSLVRARHVFLADQLSGNRSQGGFACPLRLALEQDGIFHARFGMRA